jgi:hypothetical protein
MRFGVLAVKVFPYPQFKNDLANHLKYFNLP